MIQFGRDLVHRGAGKTAAGVNGPLVCMQPWECRQQRRMDVEQPSRITRNESWRENAHESSQNHQSGLVPVDFL